MSSKKNQQLCDRRFLLQNPYAHIEELESLFMQRLHENPYLYANEQSVDDSERRSQHKAHKSYSVSSIEDLATKLQREMWARRVELGLPPDVHPVDVLQAEFAARMLGYKYSSRPSLGWFNRGRDRIIVAGLIDNFEKSIVVSADVDPHAARFTGAHEIGHAVLHPQMTGLHRDRPLSGVVESRDRIEYEADKFAAFFLMPRKLVMAQFLARFISPFHLQEDTAYALLGKSFSVACELLPTRRHLSLALADAIQFNGRTFTSLVEYFGVSNLAIAIRLEELSLVEL